MDISEVYMVRSAKGNDMLCVDDFLYHYEDCGSNTYRWVCNKRKDKMLPCRSRIITTIIENDESKHRIEKVVGEHTHEKCAPQEIQKVRERKRKADLANEPCTLECKTLKRKMRRILEFQNSLKDNKQSPNTDSTHKEKTRDKEETPTPKVKSTNPGSAINHKFKPNTIYMLETKLQRKMICLDGFLYRLEGKSQVSATFRWECVQRYDNNCTTLIYTTCVQPDGQHKLKLVRRDNHTHEAFSQWKLNKLILKNSLNILNKDDLVYTNSDEELSEYNSDTTNLKKKPLRHDPLASTEGADLKLDIDKTKITFLPSAKGNKVLCLDNFLYHFDSRSPRNGRSYWTCVYRRDKCFKCSARATLQMTGDGPKIVRVSGTHVHPDSTADIKRRLYKSVVAKKANDTEMTTSDIINNSVTELGDDFKRVVAHSKESIERRITRLRTKRKQQNYERVADDIRKLQNNESMSSLSSLSEDEHFDSVVLPSPSKLSKLHKLKNNIDASTSNNQPEDESIELNYDEETLNTETIWDVNSSVDYINMEEETMEYLDLSKKIEKRKGGQKNLEQENVVIKKENKVETMKLNAKPTFIDLSEENADKKCTESSKNKDRTETLEKSDTQLFVDGYFYQKKEIRNDHTYWVCSQYKDCVLNCKSSIITLEGSEDNIQILKISSQHSHPASQQDIIRLNYNEHKKTASSYGITHQNSVELNEVHSDISSKPENTKAKCQSVVPLNFKKNSSDRSTIIKLYAIADGPKSLAVRMTLRALDIPYKFVDIYSTAADHLKKLYAKVNPQEDVPILEDNGFYLSESIAIMQYLCEKRDSVDIYPRDLRTRAIINQRLSFNIRFYYNAVSEYVLQPIFFDVERSPTSLRKVNHALNTLEMYLKVTGSRYIAADHVTIADFALVSVTLCLEAIAFDMSSYPLLMKWYDTFKENNVDIWDIGNDGKQLISEFNANPPDLTHMTHSFLAIRYICED